MIDWCVTVSLTKRTSFVTSRLHPAATTTSDATTANTAML